MGFPRQEYWSELPFAPPGDLPDPGIESMVPALAGRFFTTDPPNPHDAGTLIQPSPTENLLYTWYHVISGRQGDEKDTVPNPHL